MKRAAAPSRDGACPCGGASYAGCCGRFHRGEALPDTAEQLMRSRYSAYVLNDAQWLRQSWHPSTCPATLEQDMAKEAAQDHRGPRTQWLGLTIIEHVPRDDTHAEVEFVARYKVGGRASRLHERSRFVREPRAPGQAPRWLYLDGDIRGEAR
ncbi:hypothetical protein CR3_0084 [Cupriavidus gilardii CR3]|uniref:UPF0225 protein HLB16_10360 n=1 Tax=Cupriavidus gilardii TaxID=82541 RepID=A0A849BBQ5_9BURK|nr:YchJ family metal-binding protein [Cupriavidus gilardii]ALD89343.1 hypothetical protein CR3_0084 [Cupriavidus gilardii CR3]QQE07020.1 hypothetical protein IC580_00480 [Cupriavidus sp. ISTL7]KAB0596649.1 hypothetical protein F7Q96_12240 [Cupriavidus gilardii]MCT9013706.1 YchJ family metal-binding protein [Cupriavidus gilardii]MCT9051894.1 YchJ family metal-binding protein [Cupriavidus gilardii]